MDASVCDHPGLRSKCEQKRMTHIITTWGRNQKSAHSSPGESVLPEQKKTRAGDGDIGEKLAPARTPAPRRVSVQKDSGGPRHRRERSGGGCCACQPLRRGGAASWRPTAWQRRCCCCTRCRRRCRRCRRGTGRWARWWSGRSRSSRWRSRSGSSARSRR